MSTEPQRRTALVTGASGDIGQAIADRLGRDGHAVIVHYRGNAAAAEKTVDAIRDAGGVARSLACDLASVRHIEEFVAGVPDALEEMAGHRRLDVLVNNAGLMRYGPFEEFGLEDLDAMYELNVRAPFAVTRAALVLMGQGSSVINVSSGVTRFSFTFGIGYAMTKGALDVFGQTLAKHLGPRGIRVNTLSPGIVDSEVNAWIHEGPEAMRQAAELSALGRVGTVDEIAAAAAFLASDDARWVDGHLLDVSGGSYL